MSCIDSGKTTGARPVTYDMTESRSSLTRMIQPSLTVGEMANPRWLMTQLPRVVSTERTASRFPDISSAFAIAMLIGESMNGTGSCGRVGAFGQMWVDTKTSPFRTSPTADMRASFIAVATAVTAPSASDTRPVRSGLAPMPPSRPTIPSVGAVPPDILPDEPRTQTFTKSVFPFGPVTVRTTTSASPASRIAALTDSPVTTGESRSSMAFMVQ